MNVKKIENQPTQQTTKSSQVIPKVRYHPSIQVSQGRTRISQVNKVRTQTRMTTVHKKQAEVTDQRTGLQQVERQEPKDMKVKKIEIQPTQQTTKNGQVIPEVPLDKSVVKQVEILTRGQRTNPHWFAWRNYRITASVAHRIAHSRFAKGTSHTPPSSYLAAITGGGPRVQTRAMSWGVQKEAEAVKSYQKLKTAALGRSVSVQECGLFIDVQRSWLAASPDGIVTDSDSGQWLLCLEVKCPYKHRERRVEDACKIDPAFCLQIQDPDRRGPGEPPVYQLKTSHSYFTQIQVQLAVTGLQQADLVVFTLKETAVVPVAFDPKLWEETVSRLETFYKGVEPLLIGTSTNCKSEL
ncbi:unnamed protein product [Ophioblennius macclurei]